MSSAFFSSTGSILGQTVVDIFSRCTASGYWTSNDWYYNQTLARQTVYEEDPYMRLEDGGGKTDAPLVQRVEEDSMLNQEQLAIRVNKRR